MSTPVAVVSAAELAPRLGVCTQAVNEWAAKGLIPFVQYGKQRRYIAQDVIAVVEAMRAEPTSKVCSKCGRDLPLDQYRKRSHRSGRRGVADDCNPCHKAYNLALRMRDAEAKGRAYKTRDQMDLERDHAEALRVERCRQRRLAVAQRREEIRRSTHLVCRLCHEAQPRRAYHDSMLTSGRTVCRACVAKRDREKFQAIKADPVKYRRRLDDTRRRLRNRTGARMRQALAVRGSTKDPGVFRFLGYTLDDLRRHIERTFDRGMSWHNMSAWHIDHIVPVSAFEFETIEDEGFRRCYALTNLRAVWAEDNLSKGARRLFLL